MQNPNSLYVYSYFQSKSLVLLEGIVGSNFNTMRHNAYIARAII